MKLFCNCFAFVFLLLFINACAQQDSSSLKRVTPRSLSNRDSAYLAKMNTTSNLLIGLGVGLCGASVYLIYEGAKIYNSAPTPVNTAADISTNHNQGGAYIAGGGIAIVAGVVLGAIGIKKKLEYKHISKRLQLQTGMLDNGNLGVQVSF